MIVIELVVPNSVRAHRSVRSDKEIKRRTQWPAISKWGGQSARNDVQRAQIGVADKAACGVGLQSEQFD
jgi:hypothetical protein